MALKKTDLVRTPPWRPTRSGHPTAARCATRRSPTRATRSARRRPRAGIEDRADDLPPPYAPSRRRRSRRARRRQRRGSTRSEAGCAVRAPRGGDDTTTGSAIDESGGITAPKWVPGRRSPRGCRRRAPPIRRARAGRHDGRPEGGAATATARVGQHPSARSADDRRAEALVGGESEHPFFLFGTQHMPAQNRAALERRSPRLTARLTRREIESELATGNRPRFRPQRSRSRRRAFVR